MVFEVELAEEKFLSDDVLATSLRWTSSGTYPEELKMKYDVRLI